MANKSGLGPNATTFIVPGECFPTRYRSTSHGFSAGMGKIGSIIGQAGIAKLRTKGATGKPGSPANPFQGHVMQIYALFMFLGIFTTLCIPETKRKTLEELSGDDVDAGFNGDEHMAADNVSEEAPKERVVTEQATL